MLKHLKIKDFQRHRSLPVKLDPGITTITGPTDAGKSAVLRALRWAVLNDLPGDSFVREGEREAEVVLKTADGHGIRRAKSRQGSNTYALDGEEFKAFGQGVPDPIAAVLRLSEINFQAQHDSPFWFSETAGEVSRRLNAVIDLSVIDTALSNIGNAVRRGQERVTICEERVLEMKLEREKLEPQRERVEQFRMLEERNQKYEKREKACDQLDGILRSIRANPAKRLREKVEDLEGVRIAAKGIVVLDRKIGAIEELLEGIRVKRQEAIAPPSLSHVTQARDKWRELDEETGALITAIHRIELERNKTEEMKAVLKEAEESFHDETKGANCPLCGNQIQ